VIKIKIDKLPAVILYVLFFAVVPLLFSCSGNGKTEDEKMTEETEKLICVVKNGVSDYTIVRPDLAEDKNEISAALRLKQSVSEITGTDIVIATDWVKKGSENETDSAREILIGGTNRAISAEGLEFNEFAIKVSGSKIAIVGTDGLVTAAGVDYFISTYMAGGDTLTVPANLSFVKKADLNVCGDSGLTYLESGSMVFDAYIKNYYNDGVFTGAHFWDSAEIFEAVIDAYEQTGEKKYLDYISEIYAAIISKYGSLWERNDYNDDIMWMVIAFTRAYQLTGIETYRDTAVNNFKVCYERASSGDLGGGLWWHTDNKTKNSCVNCTGAIAACLLGQATGDKSYYEKAASIMAWEIENMFEKDTGHVYDSYEISGSKNTWASTYNQGTFIGACILLHDYCKDDIYLAYAAKAAEYVADGMFSYGVMNSEDSGGDLIGFKGILVRWLYRYAKYTQNIDILAWLQLNAQTAWSNRNAENLIWTTWDEKTKDTVSGYDVFGMSPSVALFFNCEQWW
jgi:predicted alpha-1,6-mannanase (GH76 family)